ncbi:MAG: hypothetical protein E7163_00385 [Firmicutes bacterium]|nr:hypothetical protein [Bacillota bacterium]
MNDYLEKLFHKGINDDYKMLNKLIEESIITLDDLYEVIANCVYKYKAIHEIHNIKGVIKNVKNFKVNDLINKILTKSINSDDIITLGVEIENAPIDTLTNRILEFNYHAILKFAERVKGVPLDKIVDVLKNAEDSKFLLSITRIPNAPIDKICEIAINKKDPFMICYLADMRKNVPIHDFVEGIIETGNPEFICKFAKIIKGISNQDIISLAHAVCRTKSITYIYKFARDVENAPIEILTDGILSLIEADPDVNILKIADFANNVKNASVNKLADAIIKTNSGYAIFEFARSVKNAPINKLASGVIASKNPQYIYRFAKDIPNAPIERLMNAIIRVNDALFIYRFAKDIKGANIEKLSKAIINTKVANKIYEFAYDVNNAPINDLANALIETGEINWINTFIFHVKNAPVETLVNKVIESKALYYIRELVSIDDREQKKKLILTLVTLNDLEGLVNLIKKEPEYQEFITNVIIFSENIIYLNRLFENLENIELRNKVIDKINEINNRTDININMLNEEQKFSYLLKLYKEEDFETIRKYREEFAFLLTGEERTRK